MPIYTWERDPKKSNGIIGVLSIIPETWISDDFRHVVVPEKSTCYFVGENPTTDGFKDNLIPDRDTWAEFDVAVIARRNGCKAELIYLTQ
jgi:hypothetical protein